MQNVIFAFDFDGTVTLRESLPVLAECAGCAREIAAITRQTVAGEIPFAESFARRVKLLGALPLSVAQKVMIDLPLDEDIVNYIRRRRENCVIVTGNLDLWLTPVIDKLGCRFFSSEGILDERGRTQIKRIIDKGAVISRLKREGKVVAVGDGAGDTAMLRAADFAVAFAGVNEPPQMLVDAADMKVRSGKELCRVLDDLGNTA